MDRFTEIELFVSVAELGTLSKAAEALNISNASSSRHLAALENRLQVKLIDRNTRRLSLTPVGQSFYLRCKALIQQLQEAEDHLRSSAAEPSGTLTITASISFAALILAPIIPKFAKLYPSITIKLAGANRYSEMMESEVDLAIRTREFEPDSNISVRKLCDTRRVLAASPGYLSRKGTPRTVDALVDHDILLYSHANQPRKLNFAKDGEIKTLDIEPFFETDDGQIVRAAALAGAGILAQPKYIIYDDLVAGRLIPVLDDWQLPKLTINIAFQNKRFMPTKSRLFIDFLVEEFEAREYGKYWNR